MRRETAEAVAEAVSRRGRSRSGVTRPSLTSGCLYVPCHHRPPTARSVKNSSVFILKHAGALWLYSGNGAVAGNLQRKAFATHAMSLPTVRSNCSHKMCPDSTQEWHEGRTSSSGGWAIRRERPDRYTSRKYGCGFMSVMPASANSLGRRPGGSRKPVRNVLALPASRPQSSRSQVLSAVRTG